MAREISVKDHTEIWTQEPHISAFSESELMTIIRDTVGESSSPIRCGVGDDAAVISVTQLGAMRELIMSTDMLAEGRHFRRPWISPFDLGRRSIVHSAADCAAMGAEPIAYTLAVDIPKDISINAVRDLILGARYQAELWSGQLVGGDFICGDTIVINVTVLGGTLGESVYLSGARAGDIIAISAPPGMAAAGLACFDLGLSACTPDTDMNAAILMAQQKFLVPMGPVNTADNFQGPGIFAHPDREIHALTDVSDGLVHELTIISRKSQIKMMIDPDKIPVDPVVQKIAQYTGHDLQNFMLQGGEDHILLGCFAPEAVPADWYAIGIVEAGGPEVILLGCETQDYPGWDSVQSV